ncbi:MAG: autotransporter outer membrane beta-barrel domain-containing protein [bacterium]
MATELSLLSTNIIQGQRSKPHRLRRHVLLASAAILLPFISGTAAAQAIDISTETTVPVDTATIDGGNPGDINITDTGSILLTGGTAVTVNSNNSVTHRGTIDIDPSDGSIGILVNPDITGSLDIFGSILLDRTEEQETLALDGEVPDYNDNRAGIRIESGGTFTGDLTMQQQSSITVYGDDSFGIDIAGDMVGDTNILGTVNVQGVDSYGIRVGGDVTGDLVLHAGSSVTGQGVGFTAIGVEGDIDGVFRQVGRVSATAYSVAVVEDGDDPDDNTDLETAAQVAMQSRAAVAINANISGGYVVDGDVDTQYQGDDYTNLNASGIVEMRGSSPAVWIAGMAGSPITLGAYDTPDTVDYGSWGFINRGQITASGTFQGASAQSVLIENASIENGMRNDGTISATSISNNATAVNIGAGAMLPMLRNDGTILANMSANNMPGDTSQLQGIGLLVDVSGNLPVVQNTSVIAANVVSDTADAIAVQDLSNTLTEFTNSGSVIAQVLDYDDGDETTTDDENEPTGSAIAFDFSNSTVGVTINNTVSDDFGEGDSREAFGNVVGDVLMGSGNDTYRADAGKTVGNIDMGMGNDLVALFSGASIEGDIDYGVGDDQLSLRNGSIFGAMEFGAGADSLLLDNGASFQGILSDSDGDLTVNILDGSIFNIIDTGVINLTDMLVDATSVVGLGISGGTGPQFIASNSITLENGARINPIFQSIFTDTISQEIFISNSVMADPSQIIIGDENGNTPYLFDFSLSAVNSAVMAGQQALQLDIVRKSATDLGLNANYAQAYEPLIAQLAQDSEVGLFILNTGSEQAFMDAFLQMLAGPIDAPLAYARAQNNTITSIITQRLDMARNSGEFGRTFWLQEENYFVNRDRDTTSNGYDGGGWSLAAGVDFQLQDVVEAIGASVNMSSARYDEKKGEDFPFNRLTYGADLYGAFSLGGAQLDLRGSYAITDSESERRIVMGTERRIATASWDGTQVAASARLSYDADVSGYTLTPFASLDMVKITEDAYQETGGGDGVNLAASEREASSTRVNIGARLGKVFELRPSAYDTGIPGTLHPQFTLAWAQELETDPLEAEYQYVTGTTPFTVYSDPEESAAVLGADIAYENEYAKIHVGASGTFGDQTQSAQLRVGVGLKW